MVASCRKWPQTATNVTFISRQWHAGKQSNLWICFRKKYNKHGRPWANGKKISSHNLNGRARLLGSRRGTTVDHVDLVSLLIVLGRCKKINNSWKAMSVARYAYGRLLTPFFFFCLRPSVSTYFFFLTTICKHLFFLKAICESILLFPFSHLLKYALPIGRLRKHIFPLGRLLKPIIYF